ncbi:MAG: hypothetical protein KatS3mg088_634 [Patescibacteria group bacterium]|nr:MAG: hypothetical protein KatS3mg088_634 [Patescibacteria group bacterium]
MIKDYTTTRKDSSKGKRIKIYDLRFKNYE